MASAYDNITNEILNDKRVMAKYTAKNYRGDQYDVSNRIFNGPHHFLQQTDPTMNTKVNLGRKYMECIGSNANIVYFLPGTTNYLPGYSKSRKNSLTQIFSGKNSGAAEDNSALSELLKKDSPTKYFEFINDYANYMTYVNLLCRAASVFLGIGDMVGPDGTKYKYYNWHNFKYKNFTSFKKTDSIFEKASKMTYNTVQASLFGKDQYIQFYLNNPGNVNEDYGNSTSPSKMKGMFDTGSDWVKELKFVQGLGNSDKGLAKLMDSANKATGEIVDKIAGNKDGILGKVLGSASDVLTGASLIFPDIWQDSDNSSPINLTFNLISPYGDKESIFLNVYVPMFHLLALTLPRQTDKSANSFQAPFLVRAFSKGLFSTQMGIVDRLSIEKGDFNVDQLPSSMKIQMSIKDLYGDMMMTSSKNPMEFFSNNGMLDYLGTMCGVDISKPNYLMYVDSISTLLLGKITDIPTNIYTEFMENIRRITKPMTLF